MRYRLKANQYGNVPDEIAEEYTKNQMQDAAKAAMGQQQSDATNAYHQAYASCMAAKGFPGQ